MQDPVKHLWGKKWSVFWLAQIYGNCLLKFSLVGTDGLFHVPDSMAILLCFRCFWGTGVSRQNVQNSQEEKYLHRKSKAKSCLTQPLYWVSMLSTSSVIRGQRNMLIYFFGLCAKLLGYDLQKQGETQTEWEKWQICLYKQVVGLLVDKTSTER